MLVSPRLLLAGEQVAAATQVDERPSLAAREAGRLAQEPQGEKLLQVRERRFVYLRPGAGNRRVLLSLVRGNRKCVCGFKGGGNLNVEWVICWYFVLSRKSEEPGAEKESVLEGNVQSHSKKQKSK